MFRLIPVSPAGVAVAVAAGDRLAGDLGLPILLILLQSCHGYRFKQLPFVLASFAVEALPATPIFKVARINAAANTIAVMLTRR